MNNGRIPRKGSSSTGHCLAIRLEGGVKSTCGHAIFELVGTSNIRSPDRRALALFFSDLKAREGREGGDIKYKNQI